MKRHTKLRYYMLSSILIFILTVPPPAIGNDEKLIQLFHVLGKIYTKPYKGGGFLRGDPVEVDMFSSSTDELA